MHRDLTVLRRLIVIVAPAVIALLATPAWGQTGQPATFERTLEVSGPVDLDIRTGSGSITVTPGSDGQVRVVGRVRSSGWRGDEARVQEIVANPPIVQAGNQIELGFDQRGDWDNDVAISFEVTVPRNTRLRAGTGSGDQRIGDLAGPVAVGSGSGDLEIGAIGAEVEASTGSGDIDVVAAGGPLEANSGSGRIQVGTVAGDIRASSGSGTVEATQTAPGAVRITTGSGSIRLSGVEGDARIDSGSGSIEIAGRPTGDWRLSSSSGSVDVDLPDDVGFDLRARTTSGSIDTDYPVTVNGSFGRRELSGSVGEGGVLVEVRTVSGSIRVF